MKKLFFTLCALCVSVTMWADTIGEDIQKDEATGLYFATVTYDNANTNPVIAIIPAQDGDSYSLSNLVQNSDGTYTLPATVQANDGEAVDLQGVAQDTFSGVLTDTSNPIHLVIPANIVDMGQHAFQNCTQIEEVTVEYSATALDEAHNVTYGNSFSGCSNLKVVTQNRNITVHRNGTNGQAYYCFPFSDLTSITTVYIGEEVTSLSNNAYNSHYSGNLETVYCYASNPPTLDQNAFSNHKEGCILYVHPYSLQLYQDNTSWVDIFGYENIKAMDEEEEQPEGTLMDITTGLFFEIDESTSVVSIIADQESGAYYDANLVPYSYDAENNVTAYTLPYYVEDKSGTSGYVTRVDTCAFENSAISGHLVIPATINDMGKRAFAGCTGVTEVTYEYNSTALHEENRTNMSDGSFMNCSGVKTVNLYRDINYDSDVANQQCGPFRGVTSINTVNVGPRVTYIPSYIFRPASGTNNINTINCYAIEPPTLGTIPFSTLPDGYAINVPQGILSDYQTSWTDYSNFAELDNAFAITTHDNGEGTAYATFYNSASDVELFDGELTAYYAYQLENEDDGNLYIDIASIGSTVPAATGVIVETEKEGTYLAIATGTYTTFSETNDLYGYDEATPIDNPGEGYLYYLLSSYNEQVGFYWGEEDGAAFTCQAHRAYLALPQGAVNGSEGISIRKGNGGEDTTGISSVESATEGATVKGIYTIQGVRVNNMNQPGLYIVDGRKVLVK